MNERKSFSQDAYLLVKEREHEKTKKYKCYASRQVIKEDRAGQRD